VLHTPRRADDPHQHRLGARCTAQLCGHKLHTPRAEKDFCDVCGQPSVIAAIFLRM
jgi:rRNA maturation endonuclease Nob1